MSLPDPFSKIKEYTEYSENSPVKTITELQTLDLVICILGKNRWQTKLSPCKSKWIAESNKQGYSQDQIDYAFAMIEWIAEHMSEGYQPAGIDRIWRAKNVSSHTFNSLVRKYMKTQIIDYHPGSNNQVIDIVHPSLYPVINGVTRDKNGSIIKWPVKKIAKKRYDNELTVMKSDKFQWLPTEFYIKNGKTTINGYINNLHDDNLVVPIAEIFDKMIPMFELCLGELVNPPYSPRVIFENESSPWYKDNNKDNQDYDSEEDYEDDYDEFAKYEFVPPKIQSFRPPNYQPYSLEGKTLQVITKIAEIRLTPENPTYKGGVWHMEGMENESIIASGIYYFKNGNITESKLAFRQQVSEPTNYSQNDRNGVEKVYGLVDEESCIQQLGSLKTEEGTILVFPNTYQHRVREFKLQDKTKNGVRKILVFFLVNPEKRILSTNEIPPQYDLYSMKQAKKYREELMQERKYVEKEINNLVERECSLCEH